MNVGKPRQDRTPYLVNDLVEGTVPRLDGAMNDHARGAGKQIEGIRRQYFSGIDNGDGQYRQAEGLSQPEGAPLELPQLARPASRTLGQYDDRGPVNDSVPGLGQRYIGGCRVRAVDENVPPPFLPQIRKWESSSIPS